MTNFEIINNRIKDEIKSRGHNSFYLVFSYKDSGESYYFWVFPYDDKGFDYEGDTKQLYCSFIFSNALSLFENIWLSSNSGWMTDELVNSFLDMEEEFDFDKYFIWYDNF